MLSLLLDTRTENGGGLKRYVCEIEGDFVRVGAEGAELLRVLAWGVDVTDGARLPIRLCPGAIVDVYTAPNGSAPYSVMLDFVARERTVQDGRSSRTG